MIDLILGLVIALLAAGGLARGVAISFFALVIAFTGCMIGLMIGGILGVEDARFLFGAVGAALAAAGVSLKLSSIIEAVRDWYPSTTVKWIDRSIGAVFMGCVGVVLAWVATVVAFESPMVSAKARESFRASLIASAVSNVAPPTGSAARVLVRSGIIPALSGPVIVVDPPDETLKNAAPVQRAISSVIQVVGEACGQRFTGTGWVYEHDTVVTNAHVVAGQKTTFVRLRTTRGSVDVAGVVVAFDPVNDIAIIRVRNLPFTGLSIKVAPETSTAGVVIGFPARLGLQLTAARFDREMLYDINDIYDKPAGERKIVVYRGKVLHGNSGSPIVDANGLVLATVAASAIGQLVDGGFAVPNSVPQSLIRGATEAAVSTGPCIEG